MLALFFHKRAPLNKKTPLTQRTKRRFGDLPFHKSCLSVSVFFVPSYAWISVMHRLPVSSRRHSLLRDKLCQFLRGKVLELIAKLAGSLSNRSRVHHFSERLLAGAFQRLQNPFS